MKSPKLTPGPETTYSQDPNDLVIELVQYPPSLPPESQYSLRIRIFGDGHYVKVEGFDTSRERESPGVLSKEELDQIMSLVQKTGFMKLNSEYKIEVVGALEKSITVKLLNQTKTVSVYGYIPPAFKQVYDSICKATGAPIR
jgi:hypothetical protein